ncbi:S-adenosyl-L-methionine-dependent tRNA 4-demethylwyosine synthase TYW1 isoform X2 [Oryctolagus cuniculus]|uniref:S-adenosyl-L-methionine-dependent tRNA 4-demethylwyosine synthase TYW1 isoform X2 n=1 Tax=Oryctolagus cuniculus TaxID=9986 RepID=UPI0038798131
MDPPLDAWGLSSSLLSLWINRFYIYWGFAFGISLWICVQIVIKRQAKNSQVKSVSKANQELMTNGYISLQKREIFVSGVKIFYGSQTGTAKGFAASLAEAVTSLDLPVEAINLKEYDPDDHLAEEVTSRTVCAFLLATYTDGRPPESAEWFCKWLEEAASDFRFDKTYLKGMRYAVFGLGNSAYSNHFNKVGKNVDRWLWKLGAHRVLTRGEGDCNVAKSKHGSIEADFRAWKAKFISRLRALCKGEKKSCGGNCKKGKCESKQHGPEEVEPGPHTQDEAHHRGPKEEEPCESTNEEECGPEDHQGFSSVVDVEDLGKLMDRGKKEKREKEQQEEKTSLFRSTGKNEDDGRRAMITPALREALTKQGYQLIGSHSGVKLCRWTKSMLRGRGGCYKHTFYGIESHRCMETTPSLACANKCVFCWRNLKPVTQLYVSVDASTKDSLKKIDRPLFKDFWQRFLDSLKALATKQQRTVYRLTLVKAWNLDELQAYAELVSLGNPDFIEVKGVTYCGASSASSLTMANVPWHEEVVRFVRELVELIPDYDIACEHEHSNCLLIAHKRFKVDGEWWTWIDYGRFQELIQAYEDSGGSETFSAQDYMAKTPQWALFGASERGFDPKDTRYQRKNKPKAISGC